MIETFIRRPVLSLVISLVITLLGVLSLFTLPVTQFPDIVPPSVVVTARYNGANADVCAKAVATPLERAVNGVPGMTYMTSVSSNDGVTLLQVFFKVGTDPDQAAVNVQNRVTTVLDELPEEVIRAGVITEKEINSMLLYLNIFSRDTTVNEEFIYNFADINVLHELKRIEGVGFVDIMGAREYSMRVWLYPDRMLAYNVSTEEVIEALRAQNIEAAPGVVGENSGKSSQVKQYVLKYPGKFNSVEQYEQVVLRADPDGSVLRLRDIADVEFGTVSYDMSSRTDGRPSASIMIKQRPGSNARDVIREIKAKMAELKESFPAGIEYNFAYDVSRFLDASIAEVIRTLVEAFILVFIVVFVFLQDFRSTLIPALAVPVALIGSLAFMQVLGFSINMLTLFALVLAIGIVVDNAIVVVEAVHVKMTEHQMPAMEATIGAMKEISGAIVAITLVMSAVFIPVAFLSGPVGVFYRQFSITLAVAIVISGVNALTLTPALCALMLRHAPAKPRRTLLQKGFALFNLGYTRSENGYASTVARIAGRRLITVAVTLGFALGTWGLGALLPGGFIPTEDQSIIYVNVTTPPGSTLERTEQVLEQIQETADDLPAVDNISTLAGFSLMSDITGASFGMAMINLKPWEDREESVEKLIAELRQKTRHITDAEIEYFAPPTVPGFGNASGFELRLLDKTRRDDLQRTDEVTDAFIAALNDRPEIGMANTSFNPSFPQYMIHVDQEMAAKKGVTIENAMSTLQTLLGSYYATNFIRFGQMYKVMLQASPKYRGRPEDLLDLYVKNDAGQMVSFSSFVRLEPILGPEQITRYNMYPAAMINGDAAPGFSSGEAIEAIRQVAANLPPGFDFEWSGMTREQVLSGNQAIWIFLICLVFVYLLLAAQYESFLLPMPVILSLPAGVFGSFAFLYAAGLENNIYAQVALVMLIGLLGKNAILIIEFAHQARKRGLNALQAAVQGARARLRPILMTSFAFIAGLIPLCVATGAGAMGNRSIGMAAAGGMLVGTLAGVLLVPGLYLIFAPGRRKAAEGQRGLPGTMLCMLAAVLFAGACSLPRNAMEPPRPEMPRQFIAESDADTGEIVNLSWKKFFADTVLLQLIDTALARNADLQIALERIRAARAELRIRRGAQLPVVQGVGAAGWEHFGDYTMTGVGNFDTNLSPNIKDEQKVDTDWTPDYFLGIRTAWEADIWGKLKHRRRAALHRVLASEDGARAVQTALVAEVASAYYHLLALDAEMEIVQKNIALQEKALEVVKYQKEGGRATELAVQQFAAQLYNTRTLSYALKQEITETENMLNVLMGRFSSPIPRAGAFADRELPARLHAGSPAQLLIRRPDIRESERLLQASGADLAAARAALLPSLRLSPYLGYHAFSGAMLFQPASIGYGLLSELTGPLFNRSQLRGEYAQADAQRREAYHQYVRSVTRAYAEVVNALQRIDNTRSAIGLRQLEVEELRKAVATAQDLYLAGYANYLEVITAQKGVLSAELSLMQEKADLYKSIIGLYRSLGGGWSE